MFYLLSEGKQNTKLGKNRSEDYRLFSLNLKPAKRSGYNVCPFATEACIEACVGHNGHFSMEGGAAHKAQIRRTKLFFEQREMFFVQLYADIERARSLAKKQGKIAAIRLNAYSDLNWEKLSVRFTGENLYEKFYDVVFYDYTKDIKKATFDENVNYSITFSYNENVDIKMIPKLVSAGINVAVVFEKLPETFMGIAVVDGDVDDNRFLDPEKVIVGLKFKGSKKKLLEGISKGFVIPKIMSEKVA